MIKNHNNLVLNFLSLEWATKCSKPKENYKNINSRGSCFPVVNLLSLIISAGKYNIHRINR